MFDWVLNTSLDGCNSEKNNYYSHLSKIHPEFLFVNIGSESTTEARSILIDQQREFNRYTLFF